MEEKGEPLLLPSLKSVSLKSREGRGGEKRALREGE